MPNWRPRNAASYAHALAALLPVGEVWPRDPASTLMRLVAALADVVARWSERVAKFLLIEAFPPTSVDLLTDWERVLGLPEPCFPLALSIEERRLQVLEKLRRRPGAQSRAYFTDIARRLGYHDDGPSPYQLPIELPAPLGRLRQVEITEFRPFQFGVSRFGDPTWRFAPPRMRFCWLIKVPGARLTWFRFGASSLGQDPHLAIAYAKDLECILQKLKPAHTNLIFDYTGD